MPFREVEFGTWPQRSSAVPRRRPTSIETTLSTYKHVCSRAVNPNKDLLSRDSSTVRVSRLSNEGGLKAEVVFQPFAHPWANGERWGLESCCYSSLNARMMFWLATNALSAHTHVANYLAIQVGERGEFTGDRLHMPTLYNLVAEGEVEKCWNQGDTNANAEEVYWAFIRNCVGSWTNSVGCSKRDR